MKSYCSKEVIDKLKADGWYRVRTRGDHYQFKHPIKKGTVTVQHPKKDLTVRDLKSIEKQSGLKFE